MVIQTDEEWRALLPSHCWHVDKRPYKKTYALTLGKVESFTTSLGYATKRGQNSMAKYRPSPALDLRVPAPVVPCLTCEPVRVMEPYIYS